MMRIKIMMLGILLTNVTLLSAQQHDNPLFKQTSEMAGAMLQYEADMGGTHQPLNPDFTTNWRFYNQ